VKRILFVAVVVLAALCFLLAIYYSIPGVAHLSFIYDKGRFLFINPVTQPIAAKLTHHKYTAALLGVAALLGAVAWLIREKRGMVRTA